VEPDFQVLAVVTQPDKRRGRGNQLTPSPVKVIATAHRIPVYQPKRVKQDSETLDCLQALQADAFVVVAYGQILSPQILAMPRLGCVNAHGSILPKYRGAAPIQWSLFHGETETGITTMLMDAGMDTGAMLLIARTPIALLETAQDLAERLAQMSADLLPNTLRQLDQQTLQPIPQIDADATYAPLIKKPDYELDWTTPAIALHNQIRGFVPNCVTQFRGETLKILATAPLGADYWALLPPEIRTLEADWSRFSLEPASAGTIVHLAKGLGAIVQTGDGTLLLREVQLAGKRAQTGADFANGSRLAVGEQLGSASASL
jgi:methionyl-tRNA formyltransferase